MLRLRHFLAAMLLIPVALCSPLIVSDERQTPRRVDPAAWGSDHVGKPLPPYVTGDECLFCHRTIGPSWPENSHQLTIRPADPDDPAIAALRKTAGGDSIADQVRYLLGSKRRTRFLKPSSKYGKLELFSTAFVPKSAANNGQLRLSKKPHWNKPTFGDRCAGCHATAVDTKTRAFAARSLDCFTCHGDVPLGHTKDIRQVLLSKKNRDPRVIISICGQCHLRGGKSKSSDLPYPNTFVAGDNLFRDFQVSFKDEAIKKLPIADQHIFLNARDVAVFGRTDLSCISCHNVHRQSSDKHQDLDHGNLCASCHVPGSDHTELKATFLRAKASGAHSRVCDY